MERRLRTFVARARPSPQADLTTHFRTLVIVQAWALMITQAPCVSLPSADFYPFTYLNKC